MKAFDLHMPLVESVTPQWLSGLVGDIPKSLLDSVLGQTAIGATRLAGPSVYQKYLSDEWESSPYYAPEFRNPYGRRTGGY